MATYWSGSAELTNGQVAVVQTRVVASDGNGFTLTLSLDTPFFELTCLYDGSRFFCEHPGEDFFLSAEELDMSPLVRTYMVRITFSAVETATTTAEWNITAGNATLEQSSLTAE